MKGNGYGVEAPDVVLVVLIVCVLIFMAIEMGWVFETQ